ncbi:hypothetical protein D3C87_1906970 [compost metagenome]
MAAHMRVALVVIRSKISLAMSLVIFLVVLVDQAQVPVLARVDLQKVLTFVIH